MIRNIFACGCCFVVECYEVLSVGRCFVGYTVYVLCL